MLATAACRDAKNGPEFIAKAQRICRTQIDVISGKREAQLTALGVVSGFHRPDGIVGDLGGGSLELVDVKGTRVKRGATLPLGGLALQDRAGKSIKKAEKIVKQALAEGAADQVGQGPRVLCGRRHLALARAAAHGADRLSAARHARLCGPRQGGAGVLPAGAPRAPGNAVADRGGGLGPPAAAALCRAGARAHPAADEGLARWCSPRSACARA